MVVTEKIGRSSLGPYGRATDTLRVGALEWNSLEVAKADRRPRDADSGRPLGRRRQPRGAPRRGISVANRKLIDRRLELYDKLARPLNDLYCFFHLVGNFRDVAPPAAVARNRQLGKAVNVNEFLMSPEFRQRYDEFMAACFKTYTGPAKDAKLRSSVDTQRTERQSWDEAWERCFVARHEEVTPNTTIRDRYRALMFCFADMIGVHQLPGSGTHPDRG